MSQEVQTVLIFRALKMGDMLCSLPAIRAIRQTFPKAKLTLVSHPVMKNLFSRYPHYIDEFIAFPGFPGMPESYCDAEECLRFIKYIQEREFDLAIQLHGSGELSNPLVKLFNAKKTAGFYQRSDNFCPENDFFIPYPEKIPEVQRCLRIMTVFSDENWDEEIEFPLWPQDNRILIQELQKHSIHFDKQYFCIHPGASTESKRWAPEKFAAIGDYLVSKGFQVAFTGSAAESLLVSKIQNMMGAQSFNVAAPDLPIGALAALIHHSRGLICNDTGVSHLASALRKSSLVIFSETDPVRWAPMNKNRHRSLIRPEIEEVIQELKTFLMENLEEVV